MENNKCINIVCHYASIYGGNFIPSILSLSNSLKEQYRVIFTFPKEANDRNWVKYLIDNKQELFFIDFSNKAFKKELKKINSDNNVEVLYTHFISGLRIKSIYPFSKRMKLVIHIHSDFSGGIKENFLERIKSFIEHKVLRRDASYLFVSSDAKERFKNKDNYYFVPNALCLDRVPCEKTDISSFKKEHDIKDDDTVFLVFGWSSFVKGVDIAVKAFLASYDNKSKLIVVHKRDDGYEQCINYLKDKIGNDAFLNDKRIVFIKPNEDVFSLYGISDVLISSSRSEGFSYSILEALYFNMHVLSSDIVGVKWCKQYENVSFYDTENYLKLSELINNNKGFKKSKNTNEKMLRDYNITNWVKTISSIINK